MTEHVAISNKSVQGTHSLSVGVSLEPATSTSDSANTFSVAVDDILGHNQSVAFLQASHSHGDTMSSTV